MVSRVALVAGAGLIGLTGYALLSRSGSEAEDPRTPGFGSDFSLFERGGTVPTQAIGASAPDNAPKKDVAVDAIASFLAPSSPPTGGSEPFRLVSRSSGRTVASGLSRRQLEQLSSGRSVRTSSGTTKIETIDSKKQVVTASQPKRDAQGKTAFDRLIERNRAAKKAKAKKGGDSVATV